MAAPTGKVRKGTLSKVVGGNRSDIIKAGRKNTYRTQNNDAGTQKNPGISIPFKGQPIKKIGTQFKIYEYPTPPGTWHGSNRARG